MIEVIELDHLTVRSLFGLVHALFPAAPLVTSREGC
jgi:hypothetical protein